MESAIFCTYYFLSFAVVFHFFENKLKFSEVNVFMKTIFVLCLPTFIVNKFLRYVVYNWFVKPLLQTEKA